MTEQMKRRGRPNIVGIDKGIGPLEARVVRAVSELSPPATARDVCDTLGRDGYFAYQGVLNCMNRLVRKGILGREKQGPAYAYRLAVTLDELTAEVVSNVLGHMGGELERVICRVLEIDPDIGAEQIAALRERVRAMARKQGKR